MLIIINITIILHIQQKDLRSIIYNNNNIFTNFISFILTANIIICFIQIKILKFMHKTMSCRGRLYKA